jgi:demethylmenaquinone methyltransferase/2-methoxy-6-polyprenyl-1,4-benzoquinol methylase
VSPPNEPPARQSLEAITAQYDRVARFYRLLEPLFLILPRARRKAVAALALKPGDTVLEIGAGTGRNLPYLIEAVGPRGSVIAVDASPGMLAEARKLVEHRGWSNVQLSQQDAAQLRIDRDVDAVLFSLSYSVLPDPRPALERAWERMRPGARVVVMDEGLPDTLLGRLLRPIAALLIKLGPGDPYSRPWDDLVAYGPITTERFLFDLYYVCSVTKQPA